MCHFALSCICQCASLCVVVHHHASLCFIIYCCALLCAIVHHCVLLCIIIVSRHVSSCVILHCFASFSCVIVHFPALLCVISVHHHDALLTCDHYFWRARHFSQYCFIYKSKTVISHDVTMIQFTITLLALPCRPTEIVTGII